MCPADGCMMSAVAAVVYMAEYCVHWCTASYGIHFLLVEVMFGLA